MKVLTFQKPRVPASTGLPVEERYGVPPVGSGRASIIVTSTSSIPLERGRGGRGERGRGNGLERRTRARRRRPPFFDDVRDSRVRPRRKPHLSIRASAAPHPPHPPPTTTYFFLFARRGKPLPPGRIRRGTTAVHDDDVWGGAKATAAPMMANGRLESSIHATIILNRR